MVMVNEKGVESMLEKEKVGFIKIEGKVSSEARKTLVDRFQHNATSYANPISKLYCIAPSDNHVL